MHSQPTPSPDEDQQTVALRSTSMLLSREINTGSELKAINCFLASNIKKRGEKKMTVLSLKILLAMCQWRLSPQNLRTPVPMARTFSILLLFTLVLSVWLWFNSPEPVSLYRSRIKSIKPTTHPRVSVQDLSTVFFSTFDFGQVNLLTLLETGPNNW